MPAMLIASAVTAVKGDLSNKDAVKAALKKADFTSLRGGFKFNTNGYPHPGFLSRESGEAPGREIRNGNRPEGVFERQRSLSPRIAPATN